MRIRLQQAQDPQLKKLKELILFIATENRQNPAFGKTVLNKQLFYADAYWYALHGKTITGTEYQRLAFGPAPRRLLPAVEELINEGAAEWAILPTPSGEREQLRPLRSADSDVFSEEELDHVRYIVKELHGVSAVDVSAFSHRHPSWQCYATGETIDMRTFLVVDREVTVAEKEQAFEILEKRNAFRSQS